MVKTKIKKINTERILLNQRELSAWDLEKDFCQVQNIVFARLTENIQYIFLASELSFEKKYKYTKTGSMCIVLEKSPL